MRGRIAANKKKVADEANKKAGTASGQPGKAMSLARCPPAAPGAAASRGMRSPRDPERQPHCNRPGVCFARQIVH